ncbi:MAG: SDR family NAD(P)-dependent oxidoreductase [Gammaproteobacteria bacterium]|nr:SDR family NAD(P)-dependent oxidoreductase [Gammaproteobacteria bacterium]MDH5591484.1 SDR family NAD(P)-dependent oxidoreductase [Gammaproteobacteria bacterium]
MLENAILVTGAGRRVGYHLVKRLHEDGYTVIAHYRTSTAEIQALQDLGILTIQAQLDNRATILDFVKALQHCCSSFRALIHNASSFEPTAADLVVAAEQYEQFFNVHMMAPFLINQSLQPLLQGEDGNPADIIHITDINVENPTPRFDIYGTTKAGLHNMTLVLAKKFAPNIKVNAVAPGPVLFAEHHTQAIRQQMLDETLLEKEGGAEPVYLAVKSLLDNPFVTGASIPVDGGRRLSKR